MNDETHIFYRLAINFYMPFSKYWVLPGAIIARAGAMHFID